jgi:coenzyme F420-0:L-glutamate ligase / coenzyme F420-1:gamma-L-glutamate ligase
MTLKDHKPANGMNVQVLAVSDLPEVHPGDDLVALILRGLDEAEMALQTGDVLVVTQKVVSKAEGCLVDLAGVQPSARARKVAADTGKDPRLVEVILRQSRGVIRWRKGVLITETHHGWICANAGVDRSNVAAPGRDVVLTLPEHPDRSAREIRDALNAATGADVAVIISDTHGRAWRLGTVNLAIGVAGMDPILDVRGQQDRFGYTMRVTQIARADELAATAGLLSGQAGEGLPVILIRGARYTRADGQAVDMQRPVEKDLFR